MLGQIVGIDFDDHLGDLGFTEQRHQCFDDLVFMAFHVDLDGDAAAGGDVEDEIGNLLAAQHHDGAAAAFADVGDAAVASRAGIERHAGRRVGHAGADGDDIGAVVGSKVAGEIRECRLVGFKGDHAAFGPKVAAGDHGEQAQIGADIDEAFARRHRHDLGVDVAIIFGQRAEQGKAVGGILAAHSHQRAIDGGQAATIEQTQESADHPAFAGMARGLHIVGKPFTRHGRTPKASTGTLSAGRAEASVRRRCEWGGTGNPARLPGQSR